MSRLVAIFFGVGLLRPAAGTWGSLAALILGMVLLHGLGGFWALVAATVLATIAGFWACGAELAGRPGEDPGEFVIDEVAGQWLALLFPAAGFTFAPAAAAMIADQGGWLPWPAWIAPFVLFRLFDIWKPGPIGRADRRGDAAGVMLDDLWAGLFAGVATLILAAAYHLPLILLAR